MLLSNEYQRHLFRNIESQNKMWTVMYNNEEISALVPVEYTLFKNFSF